MIHLCVSPPPALHFLHMRPKSLPSVALSTSWWTCARVTNRKSAACGTRSLNFALVWPPQCLPANCRLTVTWPTPSRRALPSPIYASSGVVGSLLSLMLLLIGPVTPGCSIPSLPSTLFLQLSPTYLSSDRFVSGTCRFCPCGSLSSLIPVFPAKGSPAPCWGLPCLSLASPSGAPQHVAGVFLVFLSLPRLGLPSTLLGSSLSFSRLPVRGSQHFIGVFSSPAPCRGPGVPSLAYHG